MENKEMLEQTNDTENTDTQSVEENVEGIELTDTAESEEKEENSNSTEEEKEDVKSLKELLKSKPEYQEEFNKMMKNRLDRKDREYQETLSKYKEAETVLNAGLNTKDISEASKKLREYYTQEGVKLPDPVTPGLSEEELQILGEAEANKILDEGLDIAANEANKLAQKGRENWNTKEATMFNKLASTLSYEKKKKELKSIGADSKILDSNDFKQFADQFNSNADIKNIYNLYSKQSDSKKEVFEKIGSVKNTPSHEVKEFYSFEEASKFTDDDFKKNPQLFKAVENSMPKW